MKRKKRIGRNKKSMLGILALICTLLFFTTATLAWFSSTEALENQFATKFHLKVRLVDEFQEPQEFVPEKVVPKKVSATNTGDINAFVRVMVFPVFMKENESLPLNDGIEIIYEELDSKLWRQGADGYFYYLGILAPGEEAPPLFKGVRIKVREDLKDKYHQAIFDIVVKTEATGIHEKEYRYSWWGSLTPPEDQRLKEIDSILGELKIKQEGVGE